jgi:hypothetical protein
LDLGLIKPNETFVQMSTSVPITNRFILIQMPKLDGTNETQPNENPRLNCGLLFLLQVQVVVFQN